MPFPLAIAKHPGNAPVIRSGDSAGVLRSGWKFLKGPLLQDGVAANKILTIRLIKLWKYPYRSTAVGNPTLEPIIGALRASANFSGGRSQNLLEYLRVGLSRLTCTLI